VQHLVRVVALVGVVALPAAAHAQISAGFRIGVNVADLTAEPALPDFDTEGARGRLVVGGFVTLPVNSLLAFQPEALYSRQGATFKDVVSGGIELDYLQVPLLARVRTGAGSRLAVLLGPSLGVRTGASSHVDCCFVALASSPRTVDDLLRRFDFGLVAGAELDMGHLVFDGRYTWGMTNIWNDKFDGRPVGHQKNRVFSLSAGLRF